MRRLALAIVATFMIGLAPSAGAAVYPSAGGNQGTVILLHGMASNSTLWDTPPYQSLREQLNWLGWNVITVDLPDSSDPSTMATRLYTDIQPEGGAAYRARWDQTVHATVDQALTLGPRVIVGGISWGGLHAILAACDDPRIGAWMVHAPVIRPDVLDEFRHAPAPQLDGMSCADRLHDRPGYVSYGTADGRVGVELPPAFAAATGATTRAYAGLDHSTTQQAVDYMAAWVASLPPVPPPTPTVTAPAPDAPVTQERVAASPLKPRMVGLHRSSAQRWISMREARAATFLVARADYRQRRDQQAGQDVLFRLVRYAPLDCARKRNLYVVCQYEIDYRDTSAGAVQECINTVGIFRVRPNAKLRFERIGRERCSDA